MNNPTELLSQIRSATKMSQKAIAERLRVSQPTVNRILNGQPDCKGCTLAAIVALHEELLPNLSGKSTAPWNAARGQGR